MHYGWVRFNIEISKVTGPNFTELVSPNAGGIAVDGIKIRFGISSSVSEIFAAELRSRPKSGQILHVFGSERTVAHKKWHIQFMTSAYVDGTFCSVVVSEVQSH